MKKLIAPALVALSLTAPAHAMDLTELTDAERAQFRAEVRAYLMENPEIDNFVVLSPKSGQSRFWKSMRKVKS